MPDPHDPDNPENLPAFDQSNPHYQNALSYLSSFSFQKGDLVTMSGKSYVVDSVIQDSISLSEIKIGGEPTAISSLDLEIQNSLSKKEEIQKTLAQKVASVKQALIDEALAVKKALVVKKALAAEEAQAHAQEYLSMFGDTVTGRWSSERPKELTLEDLGHPLVAPDGDDPFAAIREEMRRPRKPSIFSTFAETYVLKSPFEQELAKVAVTMELLDYEHVYRLTAVYAGKELKLDVDAHLVAMNGSGYLSECAHKLRRQIVKENFLALGPEFLSPPPAPTNPYPDLYAMAKKWLSEPAVKFPFAPVEVDLSLFTTKLVPTELPPPPKGGWLHLEPPEHAPKVGLTSWTENRPPTRFKPSKTSRAKDRATSRLVRNRAPGRPVR